MGTAGSEFRQQQQDLMVGEIDKERRGFWEDLIESVTSKWVSSGYLVMGSKESCTVMVMVQIQVTL